MLPFLLRARIAAADGFPFLLREQQLQLLMVPNVMPSLVICKLHWRNVLG